MDKNELLKFMAVIKGTYPSFGNGIPPEQTASAWYRQFANFDFEKTIAAFDAFVSSDIKGYPPSPGMIKAQMRFIDDPKGLTDIEAWAAIKKAAQNGGYHAQEEWEKLPDIVRACCTPELIKDIALSDVKNESVTSSNFMRSFRQRQEEINRWDGLPENAKKIACAGDTKRIPMPEEVRDRISGLFRPQ